MTSTLITHGEPGSERLTASSPAQSGAAPDAGLSLCPDCGEEGEFRPYLYDLPFAHWACWNCMRGWTDTTEREAKR